MSQPSPLSKIAGGSSMMACPVVGLGKSGLGLHMMVERLRAGQSVVVLDLETTSFIDPETVRRRKAEAETKTLDENTAPATGPERGQRL